MDFEQQKHVNLCLVSAVGAHCGQYILSSEQGKCHKQAKHTFLYCKQRFAMRASEKHSTEKTSQPVTVT
jgi:hypothetical protein